MLFIAPSALAAPANDNFANAEPIFISSIDSVGTASGDNTDATGEPGEPTFLYDPPNHTVWYRWTATGTGTVVVSACRNSMPLGVKLKIYTGSAVNALSSVGGNRWTESCMLGGGPVVVPISPTAGTTYFIVVDGFYGDFGDTTTGTFQLLLKGDVDSDNTPEKHQGSCKKKKKKKRSASAAKKKKGCKKKRKKK